MLRIDSLTQVFTFGVSASGRLGFRTKFRAQPDTETDISVHLRVRMAGVGYIYIYIHMFIIIIRQEASLLGFDLR